MSPWDMLPYFQTPVQFVGPSFASAPQQFIPADPMRVLLIICNNSGSQVAVGPNGLVDSTNGGVPIVAAGAPLIINQAWWGSLTAAEWWVAATTGPGLCAYGVSMYKWPKGGMPLNEQAKIIAALQLQERADNRYPAVGAESPTNIPGD